MSVARPLITRPVSMRQVTEQAYQAWIHRELLPLLDQIRGRTNAFSDHFVIAQRFGAFPDGSDASAGLQAAINAVSAAGGGTVYLSRGTYTYSTGLTLPTSVVLQGDGDSTILDFTGTGDAIYSLNTTASGLMRLQVRTSDSGATSCWHLSASGSTFTQKSFAYECTFTAAGDNGVLLTGAAGGLGYVYLARLHQCHFITNGVTTTNAGVRTMTGNGAIFLSMMACRTTGFGTHLDLGPCVNSSFVDLEMDENSTGTGAGLYVKFGPNANANMVHGAHFENGGSDNCVSFDAACATNSVHCKSANKLDKVIGAGVGLNGNSTHGFDQVAATDSNIDAHPRTYSLLLQDTIHEKTAGNAVNHPEGIRCGATGIKRPDNAGAAIVPGNGTNDHYAGTHNFKNAAGTETDLTVQGPTVNDDTAILIVRRSAGVNTIQQVSQGAADSGGVGFRLLRIPN